MIRKIFMVVADSLMWTARKTGMTYNEINILLYYLLVPLTWTLMLDCLFRRPYATAALMFIWLGIFIAVGHCFREWCDRAFLKSVDFLNWFNRWGGNYMLNSVIICVMIPIAIYATLAILLIVY